MLIVFIKNKGRLDEQKCSISNVTWTKINTTDVRKLIKYSGEKNKKTFFMLCKQGNKKHLTFQCFIKINLKMFQRWQNIFEESITKYFKNCSMCK